MATTHLKGLMMRMARQPTTTGRLALLQAAGIFCWLTNLIGTDSFHNVYILCAFAGLLCLWQHARRPAEVSKSCRRKAAVLSALFSGAVALANYPLFEPVTALLNLLNLALTLAGGFCAGWHVLLWAMEHLPLAPAPGPRRLRPGLVFAGAFGAISAVYLAYLFFVAYPGYLSTDSLVALDQIKTGVYVNNNPFWHTMLLGACVNIGMALFGELNAAVAVYSTVQILLMAAFFACCVVTLYQAGAPAALLAVVLGCYGLLPYNIAYSVTMWKDILFSGFVLLFVVAAYRLLAGIGAWRWLNYALFALAGVGFCLMRTNGWSAYLVTTLVFALALGRDGKGMLGIMAAVLAVCWVLTGPVLDALGVAGTDFVEVLAVPFQQVARVVAQDLPISQEDTQALSQIFWLDRVKEVYSPEIVDPVKQEAFQTEQAGYLLENWRTYLGIWVRLGLQYPGEYLKAWVELTKGFWNGGYYFWIYLAYSYPELSGIGGFDMSGPVNSAFTALFRLLEKPVPLEPLYSIGLHVWLTVGCFAVSREARRRVWLLTVPILVLLAGLWLGTPVYAEYRYAYPMFTSFPLIAWATAFQTAGRTEKEEMLP